MSDQDRAGQPARAAAPKSRTTGPAVRRACPADADTAVAILAQAFQDDAVTAWVFPDARRRRALLPDFFRVVVEDLLAHGEIHLADDSGVVLVVPPDAPDPTPGELRRHESRLRAATAECGDRAVAIARLLDEHHPRDRAHSYVVFNAVRPARQGRGVSSAILRQVTALADAVDAGCYVECSSPESLELMVRHGFAPLPVVPLPGGPVLRPAWREPLPTGRPTAAQAAKEAAAQTAAEAAGQPAEAVG
ncbi:GNAT family N-acetyltransferase [Peterkaempfera bronchialis]|uniref:GNAT family N-acetyltransferase n=1 Tax=Peterkaempfera bronchialis TaxID=2126346 RepID=UPI003C2FC394